MKHRRSILSPFLIEEKLPVLSGSSWVRLSMVSSVRVVKPNISDIPSDRSDDFNEEESPRPSTVLSTWLKASFALALVIDTMMEKSKISGWKQWEL